VIDDAMQDEVRITVIATGFEHNIPVRHATRPLERRLPTGQPIRDREPRPAGIALPTWPSFIDGRDLDLPPFLRKES